MNLIYKYIPLEIEIKGYHPHVSGNYSGSNENSYPDEPEEFEFEIVGVEMPRIPFKYWKASTDELKGCTSDKLVISIKLKNNDLTDQEREEIEQLILNEREKNHE